MWRRLFDQFTDGFANGLGFALAVMIAFIVMVSYVKPAHSAELDAAIGDSIALGTGRALGVSTYARVGASSCWVLQHTPHRSFRYVVVSAGINDAPGPCVRTLLASIVAKRIVVILPAPINSARRNVEVAAVQYGGYPISYACMGGCSRRNFHPGSYSVLAAGVRRLWLTH